VPSSGRQPTLTVPQPTYGTIPSLLHRLRTRASDAVEQIAECLVGGGMVACPQEASELPGAKITLLGPSRALGVEPAATTG
jgi:hypothetical protein